MRTLLRAFTVCGILSTGLLILGVRTVAQEASPTLTTLYSFAGNASDGGFPVGGVAIGSHGTLYGTTDSGGPFNAGNVFSLTPPASSGGTWTEAILYNFTDGTDGAYPHAGVVIGPHGALYGTTAFGGLANVGTAFSLSPPASPGDPWTEQVLHGFTGGNDGAAPNASVVIGGHGVLYGTTYDSVTSNLGVVFSLTPSAPPGGLWTETILHSFTGGADGAQPNASVVIGGGGVLYGTTVLGGTAGGGTVFSLTPPLSPGGTWTETLLYELAGSDVALPNALTIGSGGVFYDTTYAGGVSGNGTVFSLTPPASHGGPWILAVLHDFASSPAYPHDGGGPTAGVVIGGGGVLYGTTSYGGVANHGRVFALEPPSSPGGSWTEKILHDFTGLADGGQPFAGVVIGPHGTLYGTTSMGGALGQGTVFALEP
jgi:uncharacterized repeat protein (TIGR03803 family)